MPYPFILLFNLVFTSLPVVIIGALDQDVNASALMAVPETYFKGREGKYYTRTIFFSYVADGLYQSAVCFFIPYAMWGRFWVANADGHDMMGLYLFGTAVIGSAMTCANLIAGIVSNYFTWIFWVGVVGSILSFFIFALIYSAFNSFIFDDLAYWLFGSVLFWATFAITVTVSLLPRYCFLAWRACFHPDDCDVVREQWVAGDLKDQLGLQHRRERRAERKRQKALRKQHAIADETLDGEDPESGRLLANHQQSRGHRLRPSGESLGEIMGGYRFSGPTRSKDLDPEGDVWTQTVDEYDIGGAGGTAFGAKDDAAIDFKDDPLQSAPVLRVGHAAADARYVPGVQLVDAPQPEQALQLQSSYDPYDLPSSATALAPPPPAPVGLNPAHS